MNRSAVERIASAVLYEGHILYPYRPSTKNRHRWTFGGLYPEAYCRAAGGEACSNQVECLVHGHVATTLEAVVRFLHLTDRQIGAIDPPLAVWPADSVPVFRSVERLQIGDRLLQSWQEAEERQVALEAASLGDLLESPRELVLAFSGSRRTEPVFDSRGQVVGVEARTQEPLEGIVEVAAVRVADGLFRVRLRVLNRTSCPDECSDRDAAVLRSFASTHTILGVRKGEFVSPTDPPPVWRAAADACRNVGGWPVLVGDNGAKDTVLFSPIILGDYPQIAPESPGDFFDGTEIDEMLTLRILTLTDQEKRAMAAVDPRTRDLLARTEAQARESLLSLHGTVRGWRPSADRGTNG
jgi:hypothetical protein